MRTALHEGLQGKLMLLIAVPYGGGRIRWWGARTAAWGAVPMFSAQHSSRRHAAEQVGADGSSTVGVRARCQEGAPEVYDAGQRHQTMVGNLGAGSDGEGAQLGGKAQGLGGGYTGRLVLGLGCAMQAEGKRPLAGLAEAGQGRGHIAGVACSAAAPSWPEGPCHSSAAAAKQARSAGQQNLVWLAPNSPMPPCSPPTYPNNPPKRRQENLCPLPPSRLAFHPPCPTCMQPSSSRLLSLVSRLRRDVAPASARMPSTVTARGQSTSNRESKQGRVARCFSPSVVTRQQ